MNIVLQGQRWRRTGTFLVVEVTLVNPNGYGGQVEVCLRYQNHRGEERTAIVTREEFLKRYTIEQTASSARHRRAS